MLARAAASLRESSIGWPAQPCPLAAYAAQGTIEVVLKVGDDAEVITVVLFGGTLLGGAGLIVFGLLAGLSSSTRRLCTMLGAALGMLASARTIPARRISSGRSACGNRTP